VTADRSARRRGRSFGRASQPLARSVAAVSLRSAPAASLKAGAAALGLVALTGCAHLCRPAEREIVWEGQVTVRQDLLVGPGERLVIRPGTRVLFAHRDDDGDGAGDARIVVRGSLEAAGSPGAPVEFLPEEQRTGCAPRWAEVLVENAARASFSWCRFSGAKQAVHAHRTPLTVESCLFEGNVIGLRFTGGPVAVRRNRFAANGTAVRYWESSPQVVANDFESNGTAIFVREGSAHSVLRGNNFLSSSDYHVKLGESQAADVDARENWWGTGRRDEIERLIFDREDADYLGRVRYDPPASGPRLTAAP
jgi:hypothetical protein